MLKDLVRECRSTRRFKQHIPVTRDALVEMVDLARICASGSNKQALKYFVSADPEQNARIFPTLAWAGYLTDWPGPAEGERPAAYIIILGDTTISEGFGVDHGIAAQTIALAAREKGLGTCIMGAIQRPKLQEILNIPSHLQILLVLAIGVPAEKIQLEPVGPDRSIKYYRDENGVHHVPKRSLEEVLVN
ncbi:MAG TPA: nitroreductase family protein [Candidatus Latescibacteria bacterium]|nr:nitroreductase family protein [Candidatus Latescibacterota bacterium]HOS63949.1 nitroreductase family protein [Candidatus Latescibacterota bacterium]HOT35378.1 nitroreductase family protein [Candidatus Latescibacterota bacterium]HPK73762.1 nitroreductase family protein [Candidatus Latescibacterota bacterium]HQE60727.1 nitroreductase family protein [Candidatus Latescibacterota bacterium]